MNRVTIMKRILGSSATLAFAVVLAGCGGANAEDAGAGEAAMAEAPVAEVAPASAQPAGDIVEVATSNGSFSTLLKAAEAAGLVETLKGAGPYTIFAPTDEAFAKLPAGTVDALLADKERLAAVLTYHVIPGRVLASDVIQAGSVKPATVQGQTLDIRVMDGAVHVDEATVTTADVVASNGVIHVIDTVVLPPE